MAGEDGRRRGAAALDAARERIDRRYREAQELLEARMGAARRLVEALTGQSDVDFDERKAAEEALRTKDDMTGMLDRIGDRHGIAGAGKRK